MQKCCCINKQWPNLDQSTFWDFYISTSTFLAKDDNTPTLYYSTQMNASQTHNTDPRFSSICKSLESTRLSEPQAMQCDKSDAPHTSPSLQNTINSNTPPTSGLLEDFKKNENAKYPKFYEPPPTAPTSGAFPYIKYDFASECDENP